jgi:Raf kinase inhibitor-like YbhB/YbcL family protein
MSTAGSAGMAQAGASLGGSAGAAGTATSAGTSNGGASGGGGQTNTSGAGGSSNAGTSAGGAGGSGGTSGGAGGSGGTSGGAGGMAGGGGSGGMPAPFVLSSPGIDRHDDCSKDNKGPCDTIDAKNTLETIGGQNQSPELDWGPGPAGTLSYAIGLHDTSNGPTGYTHWVVWDLPAGTQMLPANLQHKAKLDMPAGAQQSSFQPDNAYAGPGAHGNVYEFKVYALKVAKLTVNNADDQAAIRTKLEQSPDVLGTSLLRVKSP